MQLTSERATAFAALPLAYLRLEYPNHIMHVLNNSSDVLSPRALHPVFYGCYDWHSAVHGYWLLLRCLRRYPDLPAATEIGALFDEHFTPERMQQEASYFHAAGRNSFERPYGYGWLLALAQELAASSHSHAAGWLAAMQPLTSTIRNNLISYLHKLTYPIRVGTHYNTAFALALALDYARAVADDELTTAITTAALRYYGEDRDYPAHYEPGGDEYLSAALTEALLMSKVLQGSAFTTWFDGFLPRLAHVRQLMQPATLSDRTDPKIAHLDGLNLSRTWCMKHIARHLPADHPAQPAFAQAVPLHLQASIDHVVGSHYSGGHWLATFAMLALED
ncbi:hypothetical protein FHW67_001715 [Herbaspirillum sp. Sphag1AN]|uniref:DUF2891 domain-containing protein n=1 Tax=unclassified Herbaspirillum TaxID=2624150 RepID=UPI00161E49C5|nr:MULTISPECIES: DUF2891 domain-containing protein [unclassified Herbaspirillum]MBB3212435.1 hypothetical protein [Herbaspirillum sp. Sphag1AN]MBB3245466.1 hypothetical protein [Herbaspirillum sp. Sphag64]